MQWSFCDCWMRKLVLSKAHKGCMSCMSYWKLNARWKDKQKYFQKPICRFELRLAWSRRQRRLQWAAANLSTVDSRNYELQMCSIWLSNMLQNSYMDLQRRQNTASLEFKNAETSTFSVSVKLKGWKRRVDEARSARPSAESLQVTWSLRGVPVFERGSF